MQKLTLLILSLATFFLNARSQTNPLFGHHNICIGTGAGTYLTVESYCVIVGHDSAAINAQGRDMIWQVDWNERYLKKEPKIKAILERYYNEVILAGCDSKFARESLVIQIINR